MRIVVVWWFGPWFFVLVVFFARVSALVNFIWYAIFL